MGGTVAETIRRENGQILKMARRTGAYNWMFFSREFLEGDEEKAIAEHHRGFEEMRQDWLKNQESGKFEFGMTDAYGWCEHTAPIDYGLVVIDFQARKIHSMQGYDTPFSMSIWDFGAMFESEGAKEAALAEKMIREDWAFFANRSLEPLGSLSEAFAGAASRELRIERMEELLKGFRTEAAPGKRIDRIVPAKGGFELLRYEETPKGALSMAKALSAEGFSFREDEIQMWVERYLPEGEEIAPGAGWGAQMRRALGESPEPAASGKSNLRKGNP